MSQGGEDRCQGKWPECCGFLRIFRSFRMGFHWSKLLPAFCGIVATCCAGTVLDWVWPATSQPAVSVVAGQNVTELDHYLAAPANAVAATNGWIKALDKAGEVGHVGAFALLLYHARITADSITASVIHADFGGVVEGFLRGFRGMAWLTAMHPLYAAIFCLLLVAIWAFFGGAISRAAVLDVSRDEKISLREAFGFAKSHYLSFAAAPLIPVGFVLLGGLALWVGGLVGAIPAAGEIIVGLTFFLALLAGFLIALVIICGAGSLPMLMPAIAADNLDALDALSTTYSYVGARPWKTLFYAFLATCYGAACIVFLKLFVMIMLWAVGHFVGASMNWGDAYAVDAAGAKVKVASKLDAMWQAPTFAGGRPFFGTFDKESLRHVSWFGQWCLKVWIYALWGLVAACVVGFFYSASSVIFFLLRRDVDLTDIEECYLEEGHGDESAAAPPAEAPATKPPEDSTKSDNAPAES